MGPEEGVEEEKSKLKMDPVKATVQSRAAAVAVRLQREPEAQPCDITLLSSDLV